MNRSIEEVIKESYAKIDYPACEWQAQQWGCSQPYKGMTILDATPIYHNTLVKYHALIEAGANLTIGISPLISYDIQTLEQLREWGIATVDSRENPQSFDFIFDCAAAFSHWTAKVGYVELTRSGVEGYMATGKRVFVADSGKIKQIETCLGTGESFFRAMKALGFEEWQGKSLLVFGSGKVGTGLILYGYQNGANVTVVTDPSSVNPKINHCISKVIDFRSKCEVEAAIASADAIVAATGVPNALERCCCPESLIHSKAILANMGVVDEFGCAVPTERVLRNKATLNFMLDEPTQLKYIDATFALHNAGGLYFLNHPETEGLIEPPFAIENEILQITRTNGAISFELDWLM